MEQNGSDGPPIRSVILCTDFSSSDFAVALCEEAVEFMSTDSGLLHGCSSPLFSPLFLLDPFDSVILLCLSTCSDGDSVAGKKKVTSDVRKVCRIELFWCSEAGKGLEEGRSYT